MVNISPKLDLDEEILRCQMAAKRLWAIQLGSSNQYKQQQMAEWLMELKRLREEVADLRKDNRRLADCLKSLRSERQSSPEDEDDPIESHRYDNHMTVESICKDRHIEFG